ncbi:MAG: hypothetical protein ACTSP4_12740 [Candidatus Hodarchaeales archaeon]
MMDDPPKVKRKRCKAKKIEEKTITVRGIDKNLYERFAGLTRSWGRNTGHVFSRLISHYNAEAPPIPPFFKHLYQKEQFKLETITNVEKLTVSRDDLQAAGKKIKYFFRSIQDLVFTDDCDNKIILDHVFRIWNCGVKMPESVSKLLFHSLVRHRSLHVSENAVLKDVTIRNVEQETYEEFATACQLNNQTIGNAVNSLLGDFVTEMESLHIIVHVLAANPLNTLVVSSLDSLNITADDLKEIKETKILFHRIKNLTFDNDIDEHIFIESVIGIYNCDNVELPEYRDLQL